MKAIIFGKYLLWSMMAIPFLLLPVAHSFFTSVAPGPHRVEVLWAACCSGLGLALADAGSPVLVLQYK
jgi:hypothetical protein